MRKPCSQRDRLREAYYQATQEASRLSRALESLPFGLEFQSVTLDVDTRTIAQRTAAKAEPLLQALKFEVCLPQ